MGHMRSTALVILLGISAGALAQAPPARVGAIQEFNEAARLDPDLARGSKLFETCAACHGANGIGTDDGEIPAIAGQHGSVLLTQLTDFRHEQRLDERMRHFVDQHHLPGPQELTDVAAYVASLPGFHAPRAASATVPAWARAPASISRTANAATGPSVRAT